MQEITRVLKSIQPFGFLVGMASGAFVGLMLFSYLVPNGDDMIALYHHKIAEVESRKNDQAMKMVIASTTEAKSVAAPVPSTRSLVQPITSERQFLKQMVAHHEEAVTMSRQLLKLKNVRPEVVTIAKNILSTQTTEIKMMTDWMIAWKY